GRVKQAVYTARARGYADTVALQLEPHEVPRSVLDAVIDTFRANLPVWHRYWAARRRILGVARPAGWAALAPLARRPAGGPCEQRWVDVLPNRGKRDGAFCSRAYGHTPQVMMSFVGDLGSVSTLAHELGHAMHGVLMDGAQPLPYTEISMVAAETASNFNQAL